MDPDFQEKIEACSRAIKATKDRRARKALQQLQVLWGLLARGCAVLGKRQLTDEIERLSKMHDNLMPPTIH